MDGSQFPNAFHKTFVLPQCIFLDTIEKMEVKPRELVDFETNEGKVPFRDWLTSLRDKQTQAIIDARLVRVRRGNFGHCKSVGEGVQELKIDYGPGYRVYFA